MQVYTGLFVMEIIYIHIATLTFIIKTIDTYTVSPIMSPNHLIRFSYRPVIFSINAITEMRQAIQPHSDLSQTNRVCNNVSLRT